MLHFQAPFSRIDSTLSSSLFDSHPGDFPEVPSMLGDSATWPSSSKDALFQL